MGVGKTELPFDDAKQMLKLPTHTGDTLFNFKATLFCKDAFSEPLFCIVIER